MISADCITQLQGVLQAAGIYTDVPMSSQIDAHTLDAVSVLKTSGLTSQIIDWQHMLNLMGVDPKLVEDGDFGPATERAWQQVIASSSVGSDVNPLDLPTADNVVTGAKSSAGSASTATSATPSTGAFQAQPSPTKILTGDGTWTYAWKVDGDDLISCAMDGTPMEVIITSFGGWGGGNISDPQDKGTTASGKNTKQQALSGVSLAMDPDDYPEMKANDPQGYAALKGAPLPRLPWETLVTVTVNGVDTTPPDGIIDLGPGKKASKPGKPHGCDFTPIAANSVQPSMPVNRAANDFEVKGFVRILGGAQFAPKSA